MDYDEHLADRLRELLGNRTRFEEKKMFGGIAFLLSGNMCCGVVGDTLMARVGPDRYEDALARPHSREMDFTGRPMRGFVYVAAAGIESARDLRAWVAMCEDFVETLPPKR